MQWFLETPEVEYSINEFLRKPDSKQRSCRAMLCQDCAAVIDKKSCIRGVSMDYLVFVLVKYECVFVVFKYMFYNCLPSWVALNQSHLVSYSNS